MFKLTHVILAAVLLLVVTMTVPMTVTGWRALTKLAEDSAESVTREGLGHARCILMSKLDSGRATTQTMMLQHAATSRANYGTVRYGKRKDDRDFLGSMFAHSLMEPAYELLGNFGRYGDAMMVLRGLENGTTGATSYESHSTLDHRSHVQSLEVRLNDTTATDYDYVDDKNLSMVTYYERAVSPLLELPDWPESPTVPQGGHYGYDPRLRSYWPYLMEPNISESWRPAYVYGRMRMRLIVHHMILYNSEAGPGGTLIPESSIQTIFSLESISEILEEFVLAKTGRVYVVEYQSELAYGEGRFKLIVHPDASRFTLEVGDEYITEKTLEDMRLAAYLKTLDEVGTREDGVVYYETWTHDTVYAVGWVKLGTSFQGDYPPFIAISITPLSEYMGPASDSLRKFVIIACCTSLVAVCLTVGFSFGVTASLRPLLEAMHSANTLDLEAIPEDIADSHIKEFHVIGRSLLFLVETLEEYTRFLPEGILDTGENEDDEDETEMQLLQRTSPPADLSNVTIVFTDIEGSSRLWNECPDGMTEGLRLHNKCLRELMVAHNGYEVKIMGDAFMIAFQRFEDALGFCAEAQVALVGLPYPESLVQASPLCAKVHDNEGRLIWHGFRVRMGLMSGPVEGELNPLTGRVDFFGPTVNKAARVQALASGGLIITTLECYAGCKRSDIDATEFEDMVKDFGSGKLTGLQPGVLSSRIVRLRGSRRNERRGSKGYESSPLSVSVNDEKRNLAKLNTHLEKGVATLAYLTLIPAERCDMVCEMNFLVQLVDDACEKSGGVLMAVQGSRAMCMWNGEKKCLAHAISAARFGASVVSDTSFCEERAVSVVTGHMWHGNVGSDSRRYHMGAGGAGLLAVRLNSLALRIGAPLLLAEARGVPAAPSDPSMSVVMRPVFAMGYKDDASYVTVYEPNLAEMAKTSAWGVTVGVEEGSMARFCSRGLHEAVLEAARGEVDSLARLASEAGDRVLELVVEEVVCTITEWEDPAEVWGEVMSIVECTRNGSVVIGAV